MWKKWAAWAKGLAAAGISGASIYGTQILTDRLQDPGATAITGGNVGVAAGIGALLTGIAYLLRSPLPPPPTEPDKPAGVK